VRRVVRHANLFSGSTWCCSVALFSPTSEQRSGAVGVTARSLLLTGRQKAFSDVVADTGGSLAGEALLQVIRYTVGTRSMLRLTQSD
jgi:hypothetical protein